MGASCPLSCSTKGWNFNKSSCKNNVVGKFTNMAHDASGLIKPELTDPKAKVDTTITH